MSGNPTNEPEMPDPEVVAVGQRRRFNPAYKLRILDEADACSEPGEIGALLRREGLYSSHLTRWRQARERGHSAHMLRLLPDMGRGLVRTSFELSGSLQGHEQRQWRSVYRTDRYDRHRGHFSWFPDLNP